MDAILGFDGDVITFNQRCSLDDGRTYFTVNSSFDNAKEFIFLMDLQKKNINVLYDIGVFLDGVILKIYNLKVLILQKILNGF